LSALNFITSFILPDVVTCAQGSAVLIQVIPSGTPEFAF